MKEHGHFETTQPVLARVTMNTNPTQSNLKSSSDMVAPTFSALGRLSIKPLWPHSRIFFKKKVKSLLSHKSYVFN